MGDYFYWLIISVDVLLAHVYLWRVHFGDTTTFNNVLIVLARIAIGVVLIARGEGCGRVVGGCVAGKASQSLVG